MRERFDHRGVVARGDQHPVRERVAAADLLFGGRGDGRGAMLQQVRTGQAGAARQLRQQRLQVLAQALASRRGREPHGQRMARRHAAMRFQHAALAAHHVAVVRHHARGPGRGRVQACQVVRRRQHIVPFELVHLEDAFAAAGVAPAAGAAKARDAQAFRKVLVGMPVLEVGEHVGAMSHHMARAA